MTLHLKFLVAAAALSSLIGSTNIIETARAESPDFLATYARQPSSYQNHYDLIEAQESGRGLNYVEVVNAPVVRVLADDNNGNRHQKWLIQLANGGTVLVVYNISICERVPVNVGDFVSVAGQYIWDRNGGLLHWVHEDRKDRRPDGWVELNGVRYGRIVRGDRR